MRAFILSLVMFLALPVMAHADITDADNKAIDAKVDAFFAGINAGKTEEAMYGVFIPRITDKKLELQNLISQTDMAAKYAGLPLTWTVMEEKAMADRLVRRQYLVYNSDMPFKFTFVFFKTDKGWFAQTVNFSNISPDDF